MGLWNRLIVGLLPLVPRFVVWRVARRYVAGPERSQALDVVRELNAQGADGTVALLGEHVDTAARAEAARDEYLGLIADLAEAGLHTGLSIKPSLLGLGVDPDLCERLTDAVFQAAAAPGKPQGGRLCDARHVHGARRAVESGPCPICAGRSFGWGFRSAAVR